MPQYRKHNSNISVELRLYYLKFKIKIRYASYKYKNVELVLQPIVFRLSCSRRHGTVSQASKTSTETVALVSMIRWAPSPYLW